MAKNKLERFRDIEEFPNVFEYTDFRNDDDKPKGKWHSQIFKNRNPIVLELACGKGEYTRALAEMYPGKNFTGIDIKGARIWKGAKDALEKNKQNIHFLRMYIDHLDEYFAPREVSEIWITFPDPYPRKGKASKRLTSPKFLNIYSKVIKPGGLIHLKTDSDLLFNFTRMTIKSTGCQLVDLVENVYKERPDDKLLTIQTFYEKQHLSQRKTIKYVCFRLGQL
ncbi:MAG: tRNA (guanosine(46)-N7)-methyltransferase TrmB, partial [Balneolaceae bacterium]